MTDLISREAALAALGINHWARKILENLPAVVPQVIVNISGGLNQGASADYPVDVYTLDFDVDSFDDDHNGVEVDGDQAYFGQSAADVDPAWVKSVLEAPMIFFASGELVCGECDGTGTVYDPTLKETKPCAECNGTGRLPNPDQEDDDGTSD